jgi:hypothetical protein
VFLVDDIKLTSPGSGYTTDPKVTISAPSGSGTTATAVAKIGNPAGTSVSGITLLTGGLNYISTPTVTIGNGAGSGASAIASIQNGAVTDITLASGGMGSGYFSFGCFRR